MIIPTIGDSICTLYRSESSKKSAYKTQITRNGNVMAILSALESTGTITFVYQVDKFTGKTDTLSDQLKSTNQTEKTIATTSITVTHPLNKKCDSTIAHKRITYLQRKAQDTDTASLILKTLYDQQSVILTLSTPKRGVEIFGIQLRRVVGHPCSCYKLCCYQAATLYKVRKNVAVTSLLISRHSSF